MSCDDDGTKIHLSSDDYLIILCWMENPSNFAMIHGSSKKTTIGQKVTKAEAFKQLAEHLYEKSKTTNLPLLSSESMRRRWKTYKDKFVKALASKRSETGMGLTEKEIKKGLTVPAKLNKMCPHFSRMEDLFGEKSNVTAASTTELGAVWVDDVTEDVSISDAHSEVLGQGSPEFRFDGYSPPSPSEAVEDNATCPVNDDPKVAGAVQLTENSLGLSDDDMAELESRIAVETIETIEKERTATARRKSTVASGRTQKHLNRKKQKTQHKLPKKKAGPKRDLRPEALVEPGESRSAADKGSNSRSTAQENKMSITLAYAENSKARNGLFRRKLDQDVAIENQRHSRWVMEQAATQRQQASAQQHELLMVLVKQGKSPAEIQAYFQISTGLGASGETEGESALHASNNTGEGEESQESTNNVDLATNDATSAANEVLNWGESYTLAYDA